MQSPFTRGHVVMTFLSGIPAGHLDIPADRPRTSRSTLATPEKSQHRACDGLRRWFRPDRSFRGPCRSRGPARPRAAHLLAIYFGWFLVLAFHLLSPRPAQRLRGCQQVAPTEDLVRDDDSVTRRRVLQGLGAMVAPALSHRGPRAQQTAGRAVQPVGSAGGHPLAVRRQRQRPPDARARSGLRDEDRPAPCCSCMASPSWPTAGAR